MYPHPGLLRTPELNLLKAFSYWEFYELSNGAFFLANDNVYNEKFGNFDNRFL